MRQPKPITPCPVCGVVDCQPPVIIPQEYLWGIALGLSRATFFGERMKQWNRNLAAYNDYHSAHGLKNPLERESA